MTIDKAIRELGIWQHSPAFNHSPHGREALKLGIEALKRLKNGGHLSLDELLKPLPSEIEGWGRRE